MHGVEFELADRRVDAEPVVMAPCAVKAAAAVTQFAGNIDEPVDAADEACSRALQGCRRGTDDVQRAMHGVGAVDARAWAAHHFNRRGL
ncbi:MAG: hypothetical protein EBZ91_00395 [Gammaproteobacteria bacterium]|nr:hypothetical protein [Gammaproteobacteria bacterium]